jgi:hypothetical protein
VGQEPGSGRDEIAGGSGDKPRRRRTVWVVVAVALGVGVAVVRPDVSLLADRSAAPRPQVSAPPPARTPGTLAGVAWDTRGDLARDRDFVTAALRRMREERPRISRVYFAGHLSDGSRLVMAGSDVNRGVVATSVHVLHVPDGVPLAGARVVEAAALVDPQQVLAWAARGDDGRVRAVVLTRPGAPVRIDISLRVDFDPATGVARRRWEPAAVADGAVVADLGRQTDPIIGVRARGPGVFALPMLVRVRPRQPDLPVVAVEGIEEPGYRGPDPLLVPGALREQAGVVVDLQAASARLLWSGAPWKQRRMALVLLTRADGRRFQALIGQQDGSAFPAGVRALADGEADRLPWLLEPFSPQDPTLLILPTGDGSLIYRGAGQPVRTWTIGTDGVVGLVAPGPSPPSAVGADVTVTDTAGRILLRTTLRRPGFDDLFGSG